MKNFKCFFILILLVISIGLYAESNPAIQHDFTVTKGIEWAKPDGQRLTMDIYVPGTGKENYPVLIVYHGGGWLINNNSVMDSLSAYIASHSEYIVCNVNYRLLVDKGNTVAMNQIVEDAFGAVLWVKENISKYGGNASRIAVTGDSAGGHLAAMVLFGGKNQESDGFAGSTQGFNPTYLPKGKSAEDIAKENGLEVQAAVLSYPALDIYGTCSVGGFETQSNIFWMFAQNKPRGIFGDSITSIKNPEFYKAVSPVYNIPLSTEQILPPIFIHVGSNDNLITPISIKEFVGKLKEKGQKAEYWIYEGRPHAYLDSGKNEFLGTEFRKDAPVAIDKMIEFLNSVFYKK